MSDTTAAGLSDFLLARIAEDEAVARAFVDEGPWQQWALRDHSGPTRDEEYAQLVIGTARVLAECEAKRRIVRAYQAADASSGVDFEYGFGLHLAVQVLASVYAGHPDHREEWRP